MKKCLARLAVAGLALAALGLADAQPASAQAAPGWRPTACANQQPWIDHPWLSQILPMPPCKRHRGPRHWPLECMHWTPEDNATCD